MSFNPAEKGKTHRFHSERSESPYTVVFTQQPDSETSFEKVVVVKD